METDMYSWYEKLYTDVDKSESYSQYCKAAFGADFSQQGFCTQNQIDGMLKAAELSAHQAVLDIGCGCGKLDEFIADSTGVNLIGLDYSPTAAAIAKNRCLKKSDRLKFIVENMDRAEFPKNSFDFIFSIDAVFFSEELPALLIKMNNWLKPGGKIALFHSEIRFDKSLSSSMLLPENTGIGAALNLSGLAYTAVDYTEDLYRHMHIKRSVSQFLKDKFIEEGNLYLCEYIERESIPDDMSLEKFKGFQSRTLYIIEKQTAINLKGAVHT